MKPLEDAIRADPEAIEPYLVLADALQEKGDPLGEWIAVHRAFSAEKDSLSEAALRERSRLRQFRDPLMLQLLGKDAYAWRKELALTWHMGFVRRLRVEDRTLPLLAGLLVNRVCQFLRVLGIGATPTDAVVKILEKTKLPATITELALFDDGAEFRRAGIPSQRTNEGWGAQLELDDVRPILAMAPNVRRLRLSGLSVGKLGGASMPKLESLEVIQQIGAPRTLTWALSGAAPALRSLSIALYPAESAAVLRAIEKAEIKTLAINTGWGSYGETIDMLQRTVLPPWLETLDLRSMRLNEETRKAVGELQLAKRPVQVLYE